MLNQQAISLLKRLYGVFPTGLLEGKSTRDEYFKIFETLDYYPAELAIDRIIASSKYCPVPSEILETYRQVIREKFTKRSDERTNCTVCNGNGVVLFKKEENKLLYEFAAYCDKCEAGKKFNYDGKLHNKEEKHRTDYKTLPLSAYSGMSVPAERQEIEIDGKFSDVLKRLTQKLTIEEATIYE